MSGFYSDDPDRLDYPTAEELTRQYLQAVEATKRQTTTVRVLEWSDYPNSQHNRERVFDALTRFAIPVEEENWDGRTVFDITGRSD